jgi:hypothetical protein
MTSAEFLTVFGFGVLVGLGLALPVEFSFTRCLIGRVKARIRRRR